MSRETLRIKVQSLGVWRYKTEGETRDFLKLYLAHIYIFSAVLLESAALFAFLYFHPTS